MKGYITFLLISLLPLGAFAQGEGNIWIFGTGAGIDFNSGSAVAISSSCTGAEGTASISTEDGDLLMYSNGKSVWNREDDMMPGGSSLMTSDPSSTSQASAIFPVPGSDSLFYVFSLEALGSDGGLYYSIVDMTLDGGLGDVLADETGVLIDDGMCEKMTIVAGECENVWLIVHSAAVNEYYSYEITEEGISAPVVSVIGDGDFEGGYEVGVIKVSSDRTKMIASLYPGFTTAENAAEMYDFDPVTGIVSNREVLIDASSDLWSGGFYYGASFSPDDSKAYFSNGSELVQFDMSLATTADIIASGTHIAFVSYGDMKVAPDGKIYVVSSFGSSLSTINSPNLAGTACDYEVSSFSLGSGSATFGLPNATVIPFISVDSNAVAVHDTTTCAFLSISGREGATAYLWNTGATTESITVITPGTYWVRSKNGCFSLDTFHINIDSITPPIIAVSDTIICAITGALTLSADVSNVIGTTYDWAPDLAIVSGDGTPTVVVNPSVDTQIIINATNHLDMCAASAADTIAVYVFDKSDVVILTPDTTICQYSMIPVWTLGPEDYSYSWAPETGLDNPFAKTPILTGTTSAPYVLTTRYHHCEAFDTIDINVEPAPMVDIGEDHVLCDYDTLHMFAQTSPDEFAPYTYDWDPGIYMDDSTSIKPIFHSIAPYSGYVIATATTPAGCVGADTIIMTVNSSRFMQVTPDTGFCPPAAIQLSAINAQQYKWIPDYGLSSDSIANPFATPVSSTEYLVMGTSKAGCIDSQYVNIEVYPNAVVYLPDSVQIWPGESYQINPGGNALYYAWFPSSGLSSANIANPIAQPEVRTRYFYTATTENGCTMTDSIDVLVITESILDMPNAFVPGSNTNGSLKIGRRGIAALKSYAIFNRWGNKVFETTNLEEGWDGSFNGKPQPTGVYIYQIEAVTAQGKQFNKQGNVTLIR